MADETTPGGSQIRRHDHARPPEPVPTGWAGKELIERHVEAQLGPIATVYHELASQYVRLDVLIVEATEERLAARRGGLARAPPLLARRAAQVARPAAARVLLRARHRPHDPQRRSARAVQSRDRAVLRPRAPRPPSAGRMR